MPPVAAFGSGWLVRPLLDFTRAELEAWARARAAELDRRSVQRQHALRSQLICATRSCRCCASAGRRRHVAPRDRAAHAARGSALLDELAAVDSAQRCASGRVSDVERCAALEPARRRNVLRHWMRGTRRSRAFDAQARGDRARHAGRAGRSRAVRGVGRCEVRRHRGLLYCEPQPPQRVADASVTGTGRAASARAAAGLGQLRTRRAERRAVWRRASCRSAAAFASAHGGEIAAAGRRSRITAS